MRADEARYSGVVSAPKAAKFLRSVLSPEVAVRQMIRRLSIGSVDFRLSLQALDRPQYAFGAKHAVRLASKLGYRSVSLVEFGVATGGGLLALESYAAEFGRRAGIDVEVYGFDTGSGLPEVSDYRDLGYIWQRGAYAMDVAGLKRRLKSAKLILGDVRQTVAGFVSTPHAPIGFISFDLDYYTSTAAALQILTGPDEAYLPRALCYFDDVVSNGHMLHCDETGELLAIREFNRNAKPGETLAPIHLLHGDLLYPAPWMQQIWAYHRFRHALYNTYAGDE